MQFFIPNYTFDNEIILSGANLDNSYFKNRLDRYFLVKNNELSSDLKHNSPVNHNNIQNLNYLFMFGREDELQVLKKLLSYDFDAVYVSSAYFNMPKSYYKLFMKQKNVSFFVNNPEMNFFNNFGCFGAFITALYE